MADCGSAIFSIIGSLTVTQKRKKKPPSNEGPGRQRWAFVGALAAATGTIVAVCELLQSNRQFEVENRPYLSIAAVRTSPFVVGKPFSVAVTVENTGQTPAVDVLAGTMVQIGDVGFFPDGGYQAVDVSRLTLGSGQHVELTLYRNAPITTTEFEGIQSGLKEFMAHGEVRYTSSPAPVIPVEPFRFCLVWNPQIAKMEPCDNRGFINQEKAVFR
jgi:hypothetical protein